MKIKKMTLMLLLVIACLSSAFAVRWIQREVGHKVTVVGRLLINLYQNVECTIPLTLIDWGELERGCTRGLTYYIKNEGDKVVYVCWNVTSLPSGLTLSMNWDGAEWLANTRNSLPSGTVKSLDFNLYVHLDAPLSITLTFTEVFTGFDAP